MRAGTATRRDRDREAWLALAREVKRRVPVHEVLQIGGILTIQTRPNEWHSACPVCREGHDRLVSWETEPSRCWCRRCGWRADAIAVAMSLIPGCETFHAAVRFLAQYASLEAA